MTADDLVPRLLGDRVVRYADASGAPLTVARIARREAEVLPLVAQAAGEAAEALDRITIDARGWPRTCDVLPTLHRHHAACPGDLVLVDYLQLLSSPGAGRSRGQEVREIAVALKQAAMQLQVAVVAAGQLVDPPAWSADATAPRTPAVRESRAAAHAADRLEEAAAGARYVSYLLRLRKLRHSGGEGAEEEVLFDRHSCRFVAAR